MTHERSVTLPGPAFWWRATLLVVVAPDLYVKSSCTRRIRSVAASPIGRPGGNDRVAYSKIPYV